MSRLKLFSTALSLLLVTALAQDVSERIITIDFSGGSQRMENLRYGPIAYTHPDPEGITAVVSNLNIFAHEATLRGPEDEQVPLSQAQGRRVATFGDGVRVARNRLESRGSSLVYSEESGLGTLSGGVDILVAPKEEGDDPVAITAQEAEFDVDTDVSVSKGDVQLTTGNQSATSDTLEYEEDRDLGCLRSEGAQVTARRASDDGDELLITADTVCTLTEQDKLLAKGNVTIVDGSITSRGDTVFFDDSQSRAEIIGNATSVDEAEGFEISGDRIEQRTDLDTVRIIDASVPTEFTEDEFTLTRNLP